jgi:hypothetical protein
MPLRMSLAGHDAGPPRPPWREIQDAFSLEPEDGEAAHRVPVLNDVCQPPKHRRVPDGPCH